MPPFNDYYGYMHADQDDDNDHDDDDDDDDETYQSICAAVW